MSNSNEFTMRVGDTKDYQMDWATWLGAKTISSSSWTTPTGLTEVSDSNTTTTATVVLTAVTVGQKYRVQNRIVTADSMSAEYDLIITVEAG